jgi:hypothetical protein
MDLPAEVADLARRIHHCRVPVVPLADVMFRLRRAGHNMSIGQVRAAIAHPPGRSDGR